MNRVLPLLQLSRGQGKEEESKKVELQGKAHTEGEEGQRGTGAEGG